MMKMLPLELIRFLFRRHKAIKNRILRTWNKNRIGSERRFEGNFHQPSSTPSNQSAEPEITLEYIGVQYRHMGSGNQGPGPWTEISNNGVSSKISVSNLIEETDGLERATTETQIVNWQPAGPLKDGVYEIRAFSDCGGPKVYTPSMTGSIDLG